MKISYDQIEKYCNEMHSRAKEMKEMIETIQGVGKTVEESGLWKGKSSTYYTEKLKKLTSTYEEIYQEIENSILYMAKCAEGFQAIDKQVLKEICNNLNINTPNLSKSKIFN